MRQQSLRVATALLLASAALPLSLVHAQTAQPAEATPPTTAATPPATEPVDEPAAQPTQSGTQASEPVINTRASGREPISTEAADEPAATGAAPTQPAARQRPARSAARTAAPVRPRPVAVSPRVQPPAPVAAAPALAPAPAATQNIPAATVPPAPIAAPPAAAPPPEAADPAPRAEAQQGSAIWPWLLAAAIAVAGLLLFARRRRRTEEEGYVAYEAPVAAAEPVAAPIVAAPVAAAPIAAPIEIASITTPADASEADAVPLAGSADRGRPWIELMMRPVRAGVGEDSARVEFELGVQNTGSAAAHDVHISTWMLPAGSGSEMERMLIERPTGVERIEATIAPGDGARIETAVALPRAGLVDAITPVVVADARYRLPDGSEGRTSASFAVGVPDGEDLIMFDVDNPSGMHEGVEARLHGKPQRD